MAIPESQLDTWSHQGAITTAKSTADSIRNALRSYEDWPNNVSYDVYLQGSYKNTTNIRGDSDVDVVVQLNSAFYNNLSQEQKRLLGLTPASYSWSNFRRDVLRILRQYYGSANISEGNKSLKVSGSSGRLPADVVVCAQYRKYYRLEHDAYVEGMTFWTNNDNRQIINYPKAHYDNGVRKHQNTTNWYKPCIRLFKNIRSYLIEENIIADDLAPSYFLECFFYNVPNENFGRSYQDSFGNIVNWLNEANLDSFVCQNGHVTLFGSTQEQWSTGSARAFIGELIPLWRNW